METKGITLGAVVGIGAALCALFKLPTVVRFLVLWILIAILLNPVSFYSEVILTKEPVAEVVPAIGSIEHFAHQGVPLRDAKWLAEHYSKTGKLIVVDLD